jgi:putative GTP pyrophosphokinase
MVDITDLTGVRVIVFFLDSIPRLEEVIAREFEVLEKADKSRLLEQEERLGYHSVHYLVKLRPNKAGLPEYSRFTDLIVEVQVRTVLQHAWAEV